MKHFMHCSLRRCEKRILIGKHDYPLAGEIISSGDIIFQQPLSLFLRKRSLIHQVDIGFRKMLDRLAAVVTDEFRHGAQDSSNNLSLGCTLLPLVCFEVLIFEQCCECFARCIFPFRIDICYAQ